MTGLVEDERGCLKHPTIKSIHIREQTSYTGKLINTRNVFFMEQKLEV